MMEAKNISSEVGRYLRPFSRRHFLKRGIAVTGMGVAVIAGGYTLLKDSDQIFHLPDSISHLTAQQYTVFKRLAQVLLPTKKTQLPDLSEVPVLENVDRTMGNLTPNVREDLGLALQLFEMGSFLMGGYWKTFTKLSDQEVIEYCAQWQRGIALQRGIMTGLKKLIYYSYWRDSRTWPDLDYEGPVTQKYGIPSLGNAPLP